MPAPHVPAMLARRRTGIGIKPENMHLLFKAFSQVDSNINREFQGIGLGLSICRQLSQIMCGDAWATSTFGVGRSVGPCVIAT